MSNSKKDEMKILEMAIKNDAESINRKIYRRWYDDDATLSSVIKRMEYADMDFREKVAMEIIKVIIKLNINATEFNSAEEILRALRLGYKETRGGRWYDVDITVKTAMEMLRECPIPIRQKVSLEIKKFIINLDSFPI